MHSPLGYDVQKNKFNETHKTDFKSEYPTSVYSLFLIFALYLSIPIIEVPLMGLSISAPILFLIALPVFFKPPRPWFREYRFWIAIVMTLWVGIFLSIVMSGLLSGGVRIDSDSVIYLIRFAYWFLAFIITLYLLSSQKGLAERVVRIIAIGITILAMMRLWEAVFWGATGYWTRLRFMAENGYGIQFSTFFAFLLPFVFAGKKRGLAVAAALIVLSAVLMNGSRSSWIAVSISGLVFLWIFLRTQKHRLRAVGLFLVLVSLTALAFSFVPRVVTTAFEKRFSTLERLEADKSYMIRQLMLQKGLRLFKANPLFGVGASRWRKESIPLDLPGTLQYASQSHFGRKSPHNSYIAFLAENGLAGVLPYAFLLIILTFRGYKAAVSLSKQGEIWAAGIYAGFIGISIHLWALAGLTGTAPWFVYGLVAAIIIFERQTATTQNRTPSRASRLPLSHSRDY